MLSSSLLSDSSDDEGELHEIKVNRKFAKQFEENAKRKELERAKFLNIDGIHESIQLRFPTKFMLTFLRNFLLLIEDADDDEDSDEDSDGDDVDNQINTKLDLQVVEKLPRTQHIDAANRAHFVFANVKFRNPSKSKLLS